MSNDNIPNIPELPGKSKTGGRIKLFLLTVSSVALIVVFSSFIRSQYDMLTTVERKITDVSRAVDEQNALASRLEQEKLAHGSGEYYEKVAREQLGLVYRSEIVFKKRR